MIRHKDISVRCSEKDARAIFARMRVKVGTVNGWRLEDEWATNTIDNDAYMKGNFLIVGKERNSKPAVGVVIAYFRDEGMLRIPNIVPVEDDYLPVEEYNALVESFWADIAHECLKGFRAVRSGGEVRPEEAMSPAAWKLLNRFDSLANKRALHPLDERRWRDFVIVASAGRKSLRGDDVRDILLELGWPKDKTDELAQRYEYERDILRHYRRFR